MKQIPRRCVSMAFVMLIGILALASQGCVSGRDKFMLTADPYWDAWLNEKVDIDVDHFPLWRFRDLPGFRSGNYYLDGHTAGGVMVHLQGKDIARREVFWRIHKQTGLLIDFYSYHGTKVIRFRSKKIAELKGY